MTFTRPRALLVAMLLTVSTATMTAKDRIFVDQWSPTRSELYIAGPDGRNARKLIAGLELDYNASFSADGTSVVFTSERHGSSDIFRVRANGMDLERLGRTDLSRRFLDRYREASADVWPASLENLYIAYRAHVRANFSLEQMLDSYARLCGL